MKDFFFHVKPLAKEKAKNRTFTNELESRLQSTINGNNKSGTLRRRPTNDESCELNFDFNTSICSFFLLVFQSQSSGSLPNGTLFQVKVAYAYTPVHDDELAINPNDIINVTRTVCSFLSIRSMPLFFLGGRRLV